MLAARRYRTRLAARRRGLLGVLATDGTDLRKGHRRGRAAALGAMRLKDDGSMVKPTSVNILCRGRERYTRRVSVDPPLRPEHRFDREHAP